MPYFTAAELRAVYPDLDAATYPDARVTQVHDWITAIVERECATSFIAASVTEVVDGGGTDTLLLSAPYVQSITSVMVDGVALTADEVSALLLRHGIVYRPLGATWPTTSRGNVSITYTAGYSTTPPADLKEAMMQGARARLLTTADGATANDRRTSFSNGDGTFSLSTAGENRPTGFPEVDAVILGWKARVRVPGVA